MPPDPASSRHALGARLERLRRDAERTLDDAARTLGWTPQKIERLEKGNAVPAHADVLRLVELYGAGARHEEIFVLLADAGAQEWFEPFRDVIRGRMFAEHLLRFAAIEGDATVMKLFEVDLVPGLLQTDEYIDAVCLIVFPEHTGRERSRFVEFRRARQERVLTRAEPPEISIILSEAAIMRPIGGPQLMRRQLDAVVASLSGPLSTVELRITPLSVDAPGALGGPFSILKFSDPNEQDVVYLEGREGATYLESSGDVLRYEQIFSRLERDSLTPAETLDRIREQIVQFSG